MGKGSYDEIGSTQVSTQWFFLMAICSQIAGIIAFILLTILLGQYGGGFGWGSDLSKIFNYHPLFMTLGMVFLFGDAILVYRVFYDVKKLRVKILHACLLASSLIFSSIGLKAVFDSHNRAKPPEENLISLHSWIGLTAVVLFGCQWLAGFISFLWPRFDANIRQAYMPSHKFWGKVIFLLAIAAVLMGITEYGIYYQLYSDKSKTTQRHIINFFGIFVLIFAIIVLYLVGNPAFQRPPDNENENEHTPLEE